MKKALTTLSLIVGNVAIALAQTTINIGQTATQGTTNGSSLLSLLGLAQNIVNRLVPFAIGLAVLSFFWFLIKYIFQGGESAEGKGLSVKGMAWSILALFVMVSIWGIVGLFGSIIGVNQGGTVPVPNIPSGPISN